MLGSFPSLQKVVFAYAALSSGIVEVRPDDPGDVVAVVAIRGARRAFVQDRRAEHGWLQLVQVRVPELKPRVRACRRFQEPTSHRTFGETRGTRASVETTTIVPQRLTHASAVSPKLERNMNAAAGRRIFDAATLGA